MSDSIKVEPWVSLLHMDASSFGHAEAGIDHDNEVTLAYEALRGAVYFYLLASGLPGPDADDLTQESFIRLYHRFRSGQRVENIRSWLFRVAHNLFIDTVRARQWHAARFSEDWNEIALTLPDSQADPEQSILEAEKRHRVAQAIRSLTPLQMLFLHLRSEGLRYREIAEIQQVSISTVADAIRRAIDRISKELQ